MANARRKRRIGKGKLVLLVLFGGSGLIAAGHAYWGAHEGRALARELAALRASGEPVETVDLREADVRDDRNAAVLLRRAAAGVDLDSEALADLKDLDAPTAGSRLPLPHDERAVLRRALDENEAAFPLVAEAAALNGVDWGIEYAEGLTLPLPDLDPQRTLASLLAAAALLAHEDGQDALAIELVDQVAFVGDAVGRQSVLVSFLVSAGISRLHAETLAEIAPDLAIGEGRNEVPRERVRQLIAELLDDGTRREIWLRGIRGERVLQQDAIERLLSGEWTITGLTSPAGHPPERSRLVPYVLGPVMKEDGRILLRFMNEVVVAGTEVDDWPAFRARVPESEPVELNGNLWRHTFAALLLPSIHRATQMHYRVVAYRHVAAAALAARLYAIDHDGKLPASLDELVNDYLPRVPLDTVAGGGKPIGYVPDPQRPRIYYVGPNGIDDGGREDDPSASSAENAGVADEIVHLRRQPRPARPAVEDE